MCYACRCFRFCDSKVGPLSQLPPIQLEKQRTPSLPVRSEAETSAEFHYEIGS